MAMREDVNFQKYARFFKAMEQLQTPGWPVAAFEAALIKSLVPFAPYMLKV